MAQKLKTRYFTFGAAHHNTITNGEHTICVNNNTVLKITSVDPRENMELIFGKKWAMEYPTFKSCGDWGYLLKEIIGSADEYYLAKNSSNSFKFVYKSLDHPRY